MRLVDVFGENFLAQFPEVELRNYNPYNTATILVN